MSFSVAYAGLSRNARGTLWMLASAVTFTVMTMLIKYLGDEYPPTLQTFYRQAFGLLVMLPIIIGNPRAAFRTTRPGILLFRSLAGTLGMMLAFYAYQELPLAEANALSFTRTLWLVPLAAFVLNERVGPRRIAATLVGFMGTLLMLRPVMQGELGLPAGAALISALLVATTVTGMKIMTRDHTTTTLMAWATTLGFILAIPPALFVWRWPSLIDLTLLAGMGVLGTITQACYIRGMTEGDAAVMAPIDYTRLVFAVMLGYALFGDVPDALTLTGAAVIVVSTVYITLRESRLGVPKTVPERAE